MIFFKAIQYCALITAITLSAKVHAELDLDQTAQQSWFSVTSPNFIVISDSDESIPIKLAHDLERFNAVYRTLTNSQANQGQRPITVFASNNQDTFNFLRGDWNSLNESNGFFINSTGGDYAVIRLSKRNKKNTASILFHDYTHQLNALLNPDIPYWYEEGLADVLGNIKLISDNTVSLGTSRPHNRSKPKQGEWLPLETLFEHQYLAQKNTQDSKRAVFQGKLLADYFNSAIEGRAQQIQFLQFIKQGVSPRQAIEANLNLKEFEEQLKEYAKKRPEKNRKITLQSAFETSQLEAQRLRPEQVMYHLGDFALHAKSSVSEAQTYFEKSLEFNADHLNASIGLAYTLLKHNQDNAGEMIERLQSISAAKTKIAIINGHYHNNAMRAESDQTLKLELWDKAIEHYNTSIDSEPNNIEAITSAAELYAIKGDFKKSLDMVLSAFSIAPSNSQIQLNLIRYYFANGLTDKANELAQRVRSNHHWPQSDAQKFDNWYQQESLYWKNRGQTD